MTSSQAVDPEGLEALEAISQAVQFNRWMYETISPYCHGKILEIGSGIGNISRFFVEDRQSITLSDLRLPYCSELKKKFGPLIPVEQINLVDPHFVTTHSALLNSFDSVFALNVIEHIEADQEAINNCCSLLKSDGTLVLLVPAYGWLFNQFDKSLGHHRRYTAKKLNRLVANAGLEIVHSQYFNAVGILGWFISGTLQRNTNIPKSQMSLYNSLTPLIKLIDTCVLHKAGLSVISCGTKVR